MSAADENDEAAGVESSPVPDLPKVGVCFPKIPSESALSKQNMRSPKPGIPWERSQSVMDLEPKVVQKCSGVVQHEEGSDGGTVSEKAQVFWDLSQVDDDSHAELASTTSPIGGKFKVSLQTIHQKEEMKSANPCVSIQARVVRHVQSETSAIPFMDMKATVPESPPKQVQGGFESPQTTPSPGSSHSQFKFRANQSSKPNLTLTLANVIPLIKENIVKLKGQSSKEQQSALKNILSMIEQAWATPSIGRDLAYRLCDVLRYDGGLEILIHNCRESSYVIQQGSAQVLEQSMTVENREFVAQHGLDIIVSLAKKSKDNQEMTKATTGILESLFKHSEETCSKVIKYGGLEMILYSCRYSDDITLRHCAVALANLAIYGGEDNQHEMIAHKAPEWLFPLAFSNDDSTRYYAFLAICALSANKELEPAVSKSGTLELVDPFIRSHEPVEFASSDRSHIHGQSKDWLERLVSLLDSKRREAQCLAAFHFAMETGIKAQQGKLEIFKDIGAVEPLKRLASSTNKLASKFARQALQIIGEEVPYKLTPQVPLWTTEDVIHWLQQTGFSKYAAKFVDCEVDGDLLLTLDLENLKTDLNMTNGLTCKRFIRELAYLKRSADYQSCDPTRLNEWLKDLGFEYCQYTYQMLKSGVNTTLLRLLTEDHLIKDCHIQNGIHRMKIMEGAKCSPNIMNSPFGKQFCDLSCEKCLDVFISYRRLNGSQLASLLKVHLQLRGFTVFLDIEKLRAGKFDDNLLNSVRNARNFILVLTPNSLDRCAGDTEQKDWVHREIVAAIEGGCNIIPVMDNYQWPPPDSLPEDMRTICYFNGIRWIHDYQDACVDKLEKFINGELSTHQSNVQRPSLSKASSQGSMPEMHGAFYKPLTEQSPTNNVIPKGVMTDVNLDGSGHG